MIEYELICSAVIDGEPLPKERPRTVNGHTYTPKKTKDAEEVVAHYLRRGRLIDGPDESSDLRVDLHFARSNRRKADLDNMIKLQLDSDPGGKDAIIWKNDAQIVELHATLERGNPNPRTEVAIYRIKEVVNAE